MLAVKVALQLSRIGLVLGLLGAATLAYGSAQMVLASRSYQGPSDSDHRREKFAYLGAGLLFFAAFAFSLIASFTK